MNSFPTDVVVTENRIPNMDGAKLSRLINAKFPEIPIILISTYDPDYIGIEKFIHTFLAKPFNVDELIIKINEILLRGCLLKTSQTESSPEKCCTKT
jgi:DNA-binding NtrC family response regulator